MTTTMAENILLLEIPSKVFHSSYNFLAFRKLNICIMTKVLKMNVKCLDGPIVAIKSVE